ncbi:MAG TPA: GAF domain-containing protein [Acidimicrobiales bacterium]|nr:GAF domain-containing protein [Acidimicrobiales bacterium]
MEHGPELWWQRDPEPAGGGGPNGEPGSDRTRSARRSLLAGEIAVLLSWLVVSTVVAHFLTGGSHRVLSGRAAAWLFVTATGIMVLAILSFARLSSRRIRQGLRDADLALRSMELITDPALSFLPLDELLDELLARTRQVVGGDVATIFLKSSDGRFLTVRASRGLEQWMVVGALVPVGEGVIGQVASRAEAVIVPDVARVAAAMPLLRDRVASLVAVPLLVGGRVIGVVQVGTRHPHPFASRHLRLLQLVADRAAASVERARLDESERRSRLGVEQARRHLDLLSRAGDVLATALESYEHTFTRLVEVVVPSFADWFAVDLVSEQGQVRRVAFGARGEEPHGLAPGAEPPEEGVTEAGFHRHRHPDGDRLIRQALSSGRPELVLNARRMGAPHSGELAPSGSYTDAAPAAGVESMMVVPVHVRGLAFGALSLVTGSGRRGYRRSDLDTAVGLAERVAIAVERVLLWRETRQAEHAATRNAAQLRRLIEAALGVNAALEGSEVLRVLADFAYHLLDADWAVVTSTGIPAVAAGPDAHGGSVTTEVVAPAGAPVLLGTAGDVAASVIARAGAAVTEADRPVRSMSPSPEGVPSWLGVPVPGPATGPRRQRAVVAFRASGSDFGPDEESVLVLLAQMASVALENAGLYQAVQSNEERLKAVVDSSPLAIAELDLQGQAQWWNAAAAELFGWPAPGTPGTLVLEVPAGTTDTEQLGDLWERARAGQETVGMELAAGRSDGRPLQLSISTAPLRDHAGVVRGILAVMEDVSERRRMLEQFHQAERLGAMARLAGGVAHDFNNLLTVILGSSEILLRGLDDQQARQEVEAIQRAGRRAAALTSQLLAIGQRPPVQPVVIDPDTAIGSMTPMLARVMGDGVRVEHIPAPVPQRILVDPAELERAVLNLAINAKDAMPEGGRFAVITAARPDDGQVALVVSDSGAGMDVATAAHCFEPFYTTKGRAKGTGLGLAAVHAMVSQAGGHIALDTAPGQGTSFTLTFPAADGEPDAEGEEADEATGDETIMVVEDEDELRRLAVQALEWRGYEVLSAPGGAEAVTLARSLHRRPDLLVTDVVMPDMSGVELAERLRKRWRTLPVLFVSGHLDEHALGEDPLGAPADLLAKPFTPEQLARRVRDALDRSAARSKVVRRPAAQGSKR